MALLLAATVQPKLIAVLEFKSKLKDADGVDRSFFSDRVRRAALHALPGVNVMTRENMEVLARNAHLDLAACEAECEVDTGRMLGADLVVSGDISRVGSQLALTLRMHETDNGGLLGVEQALGKSADELLKDTDRAMSELFAVFKPPAPAASPQPAPGGEKTFTRTKIGQVEFLLARSVNYLREDFDCHRIDDASAEACQRACANNLRCLAFAYLEPGVWGGKADAAAHCCLKGAVPAVHKPMQGVTSGVRITPPPSIQASFRTLKETNLPGSDLHHVRRDRAEGCERACADDVRCAAYTWVAPKRECWLKRKTPSSKADRRCQSGVRL